MPNPTHRTRTCGFAFAPEGVPLAVGKRRGNGRLWPWSAAVAAALLSLFSFGPWSAAVAAALLCFFLFARQKQKKPKRRRPPHSKAQKAETEKTKAAATAALQSAPARLGWHFFRAGAIILPRCCPPLRVVVPSAVASHGCSPAIGTVEVLLVTNPSWARLPFFLLLAVMSFGLLGNLDADTTAPWA